MIDIPKDYKIIPSFPDYCVEQFGTYVVRLHEDGTTTVLSNERNGVTLYKDGKRFYRSRRQLANEAWGREVNHIGKYKTYGVEAYRDNNGEIETHYFDSLSEASKYTGAPVPHISRCINGDGLYSSKGWCFRKMKGE